ncbi:SCO family protein [Oricola sp.]|uniref:SCO family protein n=1 Tax=Oricola sp. TaxID=1979950 RepID=UPI0025EA8A51|nr:SCO family protein [Oricola sp.]MCI5078229.1 SCO family protein [Oricola sp.]
MRNLRIWLYAGLAVCLVVVGTVLAYQAVNRGTENSFASGTRLGAPFELIDHNGNPITEAAFAGRPTLLYFGFTRCPEVCPTTLYEMAGWFEALGEQGEALQAFFITVDPERDTPEIMKGYAEAFSDRVTGITGDPAEVEKLLAAWHVYYAKIYDADDDTDYTMDHTASVFLLDRDGDFKGTISYGENTATAIEKLKRLAE